MGFIKHTFIIKKQDDSNFTVEPAHPEKMYLLQPPDPLTHTPFVSLIGKKAKWDDNNNCTAVFTLAFM